MSCKTDRVVAPGGIGVLRVSGHIDGAHAETLRELTDKSKTTKGLAIDLTEVTLVSREAVDVLNLAEANGIELTKCPAYVREWISRQTERVDTEVDHDA